MSESYAEQLSRLRLMAAGDDTWDLSLNDQAAIAAVLERLAALTADLEQERLAHQETRGTVAAWKQQLTWECGCGNINGVNPAACRVCNRTAHVEAQR